MGAWKYSIRIRAPSFTSETFTDVLKEAGVDISMNGMGCWVEREAYPEEGYNAFAERLRHSVKYEDVYLKACKTDAEARDGMGTYVGFYNSERRHQSLDRKTPDQVYPGHVEWSRTG